jgi:hypothetical protein
MNSTTRSSLIAAGIGATLMFLADPSRGARRRALVRDKAVRAARKTRVGAGATWRDLQNRLSGLQARVHRRGGPADDATVHERIRAALGRVTPHHRAVSIAVADGFVMLSGDALGSEVAAIESAVRSVPGVESVDTRIRTHTSAAGIPHLQVGSPRRGRWMTWIASGWSPSAKLVGAASLGVLAFAASRRR